MFTQNFFTQKFFRTNKFFTESVRLSFVDLRWAQLYVSLVSHLIQIGLGNQTSPPASSFVIILNEAPNPKEKQKTYFSMGLLDSPVPTFIMHLTSKKNRNMF